MPTVATATLEIAYEERGPADGAAEGVPVILMHGFPDDVRAWDEVAGPLAAAGHRVIVPYLRGYGATRFLDPATPRSGQQAAIGDDLRALMDALGIRRAAIAGYDWGGRAACIVAALWPERVRALVTIGGGYNIQTIALAGRPAPPAQELRLWYIWYFQTERGRAGLAANRRDLCRILWRLWSPNLTLDEDGFARTAASWDNPDFVDVVIHSYRHRHAAAPGDTTLEAIEEKLAAAPAITVPTIMLHGAADGVDPPRDFEAHDARFTNLVAARVVPLAGHFLPRESPEAVVDALTTLLSGA